MTFWKDGNGLIYDDNDGRSQTLSTWPKNLVQLTDEEAAQVGKPTKQELLRNDLARLAAEYQADIEQIQRAWMSATILDGTAEAGKKGDLAQDMTDRKEQYINDIVAVRAKYA